MNEAKFTKGPWAAGDIDEDDITTITGGMHEREICDVVFIENLANSGRHNCLCYGPFSAALWPLFRAFPGRLLNVILPIIWRISK